MDAELFKELKIKSPKSKGKVIKIVKRPGKKGKLKDKLTPGEMARILQDKAEAKGPPRYLRRKAD